MKQKKFDCLEMKQRGAEGIYKIIQNMSVKEQLEYWKKGTEDLKKLQKEQIEKRNRLTQS